MGTMRGNQGSSKIVSVYYKNRKNKMSKGEVPLHEALLNFFKFIHIISIGKSVKLSSNRSGTSMFTEIQ